MPLPALTDWMTTAQSLHKVTQVVAAIRIAVVDPLPNYLHLSTTITPHGLSTGTLPFGTVLADFAQAAVVYTHADGTTTFPFADHTQASLKDALLAELAHHGQPLELAKNESGHEDPLTDSAPLTVDPHFAADYARVLWSIFTATARFRARLYAPMTPIVVWPEHFDLSTLIFTTPDASEEHPHMNFGFAPYSDGIERPYLYAYAWPLPATGYTTATLPPLVRLDTPGYGGPLVWYDEFSQMDDVEGFVEEVFMATFRELLLLLHK
ncbi:MAG: hypothetical protein HC893_12075 [Chloroflexaceae bacterium]|nr:hypothetical protein [Chloroflexaceae bacterium]NJL34455.1 hypothetical protein [Chloroflexaceae bacterium]NJO04571.1 hypothetical protein [Chloroflexaceae bacterium]